MPIGYQWPATIHITFRLLASWMINKHRLTLHLVNQWPISTWPLSLVNLWPAEHEFWLIKHTEFLLKLMGIIHWRKHVKIGLDKNNDCDVEEHSGTTKKFEDEELEALIHEDSCQAQAEFAELRVDHTTVSKHLKALGIIQSKDIQCCTSWSGKISNGILSCVNSCFNSRKGKLFFALYCDQRWIVDTLQ